MSLDVTEGTDEVGRSPLPGGRAYPAVAALLVATASFVVARPPLDGTEGVIAVAVASSFLGWLAGGILGSSIGRALRAGQLDGPRAVGRVCIEGAAVMIVGGAPPAIFGALWHAGDARIVLLAAPLLTLCGAALGGLIAVHARGGRWIFAGLYALVVGPLLALTLVASLFAPWWQQEAGGFSVVWIVGVLLASLSCAPLLGRPSATIGQPASQL